MRSFALLVRQSRRRLRQLASRVAFGLVFAGLALAVPIDARAQSASQEQEKAEVRAIVAMLFSRIKSNVRSDVPCLLAEDWSDLLLYEGAVSATVPAHAMLGLREALDRKGEHPEWFCSRKARNDQARKILKTLTDDDLLALTTVDVGLSYPSFDRGLTSATVRLQETKTRWSKDGWVDSTVRWSNVHLSKKDAVWTAKPEMLGARQSYRLLPAD